MKRVSNKVSSMDSDSENSFDPEKEFSDLGEDEDVSDEDMDGEVYEEGEHSGDKDEQSEENDDDDDDEELSDIDFENLKEKDPEFYQYLLQHDKSLLQFDAGTKEDDDDEEEEEEEEAELSADEDGGDATPVITRKYIGKISKNLQENGKRKDIIAAIRLFKNSIDDASGDSGDNLKSQNSDNFSGVVRLCLLDLLPAIHKFLKLKPPHEESKSINPSSSRHWSKMVGPMKVYLTSVVKVLEIVSEPSVVVTLLRHTLHLIPFFKCYVHLMKKILKKAISLWSEAEEKIRVLSFLIILRLVQEQENYMLSFVLKKLYMSYIRNSKVTTTKSWPLIIFMRQSLVQLYSLDHIVAYNHAFVFIRQCAITLRNALTTKQKDASKSVYNWQYMHSLLLWNDMLCAFHGSETVAPLTFPLVQVLIGTIRLLPVARNFPVRFHIIKALINLSSATGTFIPILPLIVEVLEIIDVNKSFKPGKKAPQFDCLLKISKEETTSKDFVEASINKVYELLLECCSAQSHLISFPELICIPIVRIKAFLKKCKNPQYARLIKQAVDKIQENGVFIEARRGKKTPQILDSSAVDQWEEAVKREGTPLTKFYSKWKKSRLNEEKEQLRALIDAEEEGDDDGKGKDGFIGENDGNKEKKRKKQQQMKGKSKERVQSQNQTQKLKRKPPKQTGNGKGKRPRLSVGRQEKSLKFEGLELSGDED